MNISIQLVWQILDTFDRHLDDLKERDIVSRSKKNGTMLTELYQSLDSDNKYMMELHYPDIYKYICESIAITPAYHRI